MLVEEESDLRKPSPIGVHVFYFHPNEGHRPTCLDSDAQDQEVDFMTEILQQFEWDEEKI